MSPKYQKLAQSEEPSPLRTFTGILNIRLRVTLGDMPLDEAFEAGVPDVDMEGTLGELLERLFGGDGDWSPSDEDLARNPDLPDLADELEAILRSSDAGRSDVGSFINHGPEAWAESVVGELCRTAHAPDGTGEVPLLDLVIEQRFTPLAYSAGQGHWASRDELREHLETTALLASDIGRGEARRPESAGNRLRALADRLRESGLLDDSCELSSDGVAALDMLEERRRGLRRDYDVFSDISLDEEAGVVEVGSGRGEDMRHYVYAAEGLDPVLTAFEVVGLDHVDEWIDDWARSEDPAAFFDTLLAYTVETEPPGEPALDDIIEAGFAYMDEASDAEEAVDRARTAIRRSKLSQRTLDGDLPNAHGADEDLVRGVGDGATSCRRQIIRQSPQQHVRIQ